MLRKLQPPAAGAVADDDGADGEPDGRAMLLEDSTFPGGAAMPRHVRAARSPPAPSPLSAAGGEKLDVGGLKELLGGLAGRMKAQEEALAKLSAQLSSRSKSGPSPRLGAIAA